MLTCFKLTLSFDPAPIQNEVDVLAKSDWTAHFNTGYFSGDWSGIALRSKGGRENQLYDDVASPDEPVDTPVLDRLPHVRGLLEKIQCPLKSARLLKLGPAAIIREHRDYSLGYEEGLLRVHFPIRTNQAVEFWLDGEEIKMTEGECWYLDLSLPHRVKNGGSQDRIHLVVDCGINDWLLAMLPAEITQSTREPEMNPSSPNEFARFREAVLNDESILNRLRQVDDPESFARLAVRVGGKLGFQFATADVKAAIDKETSIRMERWMG